MNDHACGCGGAVVGYDDRVGEIRARGLDVRDERRQIDRARSVLGRDRTAVEGGGRIVGEVCHFVDALAFLACSMPVEVSAIAAAGHDDAVSVLIRFADGSTGTIVYSSDPEIGHKDPSIVPALGTALAGHTTSSITTARFVSAPGTRPPPPERASAR